MRKNAVNLECSVGAFESGSLVGFTLVGLDRWQGHRTAFDAATGVVASHRGRGLAARMFEAVVPRVKSRGATRFVLEVLDDNAAAIRAYEKAGFEMTRELDCFVWDLTAAGAATPARPSPPSLRIEVGGKSTLGVMTAEYDHEPSWENSPAAVGRVADDLLILRAVEDAQVLGLLAYYPLLNWIVAFAVRRDSRLRGIAGALLADLRRRLTGERTQLRLTNVPREDEATRACLEHAGFRLELTQFEMARSI